LDVGANGGQYAMRLREGGYIGQIISFEPVEAVWRSLAGAARKDPKWTAVRCALGNANELIDIGVAGNSAASSSVLPMLARHESAAPEARYIGSERVQQRRLDDLVAELPMPDYLPTFLKIDVQGYERFVLEGASDLLKRVIGVQLELSLVPLYEGDTPYLRMLEFLEAAGLHLTLIEPGFRDRNTGEDLQFDGVFFRNRERPVLIDSSDPSP
jgi:FkbM family methyltransferase